MRPQPRQIAASGLTAAHRSRYRIASPRVLFPESLDQAADILRCEPAARPLAGGLEIIDALKQGERLDVMVDLSLTSDRSPRNECGKLVIGPMTRHADMSGAAVQGLTPSIAAAFAAIGNVRIRGQGTVIGNVIARRPSYCAAPILLAVDARCDAEFADGRRVVAIEAVSGNPLEADIPILVRSIEIPVFADWTLSFERDYRPVVSLAVASRATSAGLELRAAVGCAHRHSVVAAVTLPSTDAILPLAFSELLKHLPEPDLGDAEERRYRRRLIAVLLERNLRRVEAHHAHH